MDTLNAEHEIPAIETSLSKAWEFLSGESRDFDHLTQWANLLRFTEFSFHMPMAGSRPDARGGVGVLIEPSDAMTVAANMFGVPRQQVQQADLRDACAEVCNVFADCVAPHFKTDPPVSVGLPRPGNPLTYAKLAEDTIIRVVYRGCKGGNTLFVVLYDSLSPSS
jgi:hypothetical protein